jgi:hypothetical protein
MGRAMPIRKRTSHINIVVADPTLEVAGDATGTEPERAAPAVGEPAVGKKKAPRS